MSAPKFRSALLAMLCACAIGCSGTDDPCPPGSVSAAAMNRCVSQSLLPADASTSADADASDAGADASLPPICAIEDVRAWQAFHEREGVVETLSQCALMGCADASCPAKECVRGVAGVKGCATCTDDEGECVRVHCFLACGPSGDDRECRACECEAGCIERFEACAIAETGLCEGPVYGRDLAAEQLSVTQPFVLRLKPDNGALQPVPIAQDLSLGTYLSTDHLSAGYGLLKSFTHGGRTYVVQHKNACAETPCIARISPVSQDGVLGRPIYVDTWTQGWDHLTTFLLGKDTYLIRYKSGSLATKGEPRGHLRIDRIRFDATAEQAALDGVLDEQATPVSDGAWSLLDTFAVEGTPYLLTYNAERDGELTFSRLDGSASGVKRVPLPSSLRFPRGLDLLDTFRVNDRWYLAAYASGRAELSEVAAGHTLIIRATTTLFSGTTPTAPLFEGSLEPGLTHLSGFVRDGKVGLFLLAAGSGSASTAVLPDDPWTWSEQPWTFYRGKWNTSPPWRIVEVVEPYAWGKP